MPNLLTRTQHHTIERMSSSSHNPSTSQSKPSSSSQQSYFCSTKASSSSSTPRRSPPPTSSTSTTNSHHHHHHTSSKSSPSSSSSSSSHHHAQRQYYLIRDLAPTQLIPLPDEMHPIAAWQEPVIIEDEDLTFDGTPLNELYEMNRLREEEEMRSRRSSGESERSLIWREQMRRGRRRDRK